MNKSGNIYYKFIIMSNSFNNNPFPTPEDIKEAEDLAIKLKGDSDKGTLDNIIKYQNENIAYFNEKPAIRNAIIFWVFISILLILYLQIQSLTKIFFIFFAAIVLPVSGIIMVSLDRFRKKDKWKTFLSKEFIRSIIEVRYVIYQDIPVKKILDWKLAICKDYARLTASLLCILFPNSELYFIYEDAHVVSGIKFNNEIYVFDPLYDNPTPPKVLKLDDWLIDKKLDPEKFEKFERSKYSNLTLRYYYCRSKKS